MSAGDRARFESIYTHTRIAVLGYLTRRTASAEDAADLLAEVYVIAWRRIRDVPPGDQARLWLFGVARRVLANHHRSARTRTGLADALSERLRLVVLEPGPEDPRAAAAADAIGELSAGDRELLTLSAWEDLSPAQIAAVLRQPVAVVRVRLHRARRRLRDKVEEALGDPTTYDEPVVEVAPA